MKIKSVLFLVFTFPIFMTSCLSEETVQPNNTVGQHDVVISAKDFEYDVKTKTSLEITPEGAIFKWADKDTVGIFPESGAQAYFPMIDGAGSNKAVFNGGGWALKQNARYMAYFPYGFDNKHLNDIPVDYTNQTQDGNASSKHLGNYDYMAASALTPVDGAVNFAFEHLGALLQIQISTGNPKTIQSVELISEEEAFVSKGKIDLTAESIAIMPVAKTNALKLNAVNLTTTTAEECIATMYCMIAPANLEAKRLSIKVTYSDATVKTFVTTGRNYCAGKAYRITDNAQYIYPAQTVISHVPSLNAYAGVHYEEGCAAFNVHNPVTIKFKTSPETVAETIYKHWVESASLVGTYTKLGDAVVDFPIKSVAYDAADKTISFTTSADHLSPEYFNKKTDIAITLQVKDKDRTIVSEKVTMKHKDYTDDFSPNVSLGYVKNHQTIYSGDNIYEDESCIDCPVSIATIEMKFKLSAVPSSMSPAYLLGTNTAREDPYELYFNGTTLTFGDTSYTSYTNAELGISQTDLMVMNISFNHKRFSINGKSIPVKHNIRSFGSSYLFAEYYREHDEGTYSSVEGVPQNSRLYYVKIWNAEDKLSYIGYASTAVNPKTQNTEHCWHAFFIDPMTQKFTETHEFAFYPTSPDVTYRPYL